MSAEKNDKDIIKRSIDVEGIDSQGEMWWRMIWYEKPGFVMVKAELKFIA